ncbi:MAG: phosphomannomutase/phosphoglucomutase [Salinivirgaceae bacterium]|nr:phosphomannomutase/phosphoglucomutase [Salinivirgaceae bacterium]
MNAFHAYDIRGIYPEQFNKDDCYKIGFFLPELLKTKKILVGRDMRTSSPEIFESLCRGITDAGADVCNAGLTTTPMIYYTTAKFGFDASVQITASHNPREYNGMKISRANALPVGLDTGLGELKQMMETRPTVPAVQKGRITDFDFRAEYISFQKQYLKDLSNLTIAVDCSNGMASMLVHDILGDTPTYIYDTLDGTFPHHEPNPLIEDNCRDLEALVRQVKADVGVIYDGDADRVMFIDERGRFISPDLIIGLMAHYFLEERGLKGNVLQDIRTSKAVGEYVAKFGGVINMWRVGRAYAAPKLREIDGIYGGELAGHYYFRDFFYSDSGIMASLIVLGIVAGLKRQGRTISEAIAAISRYANSGEINFKIEQKQQAMDAVRDYFTQTEQATASYDFDGYRVEFADWWFNIRPSNTEPYLRLLAEAKTEQMLNEKLDKIKAIIGQFK